VDPGPLFYIAITVLLLLVLFTFLETFTFYHSIRLILCSQLTGEIDNLTVSWDKVLGCLVCRFHVAAGEKLHADKFPGAIVQSVTKLMGINFRSLVLSPTGSINLGFTTEGKLAVVLIITFSWGFQQVFWCQLHASKTAIKLSGAVAGEKEDFCKGSLSLPTFYFVIVFLYFIFSCIILSKIQKN
jgi:hypothetical protein